MPRFLTMLRSITPLPDRVEFAKRTRARKEFFEKNGCRVWSFEEVGLAGAMIEFVEAADETVLRNALRAAPGSTGEYARIYKEME